MFKLNFSSQRLSDIKEEKQDDSDNNIRLINILKFAKNLIVDDRDSIFYLIKMLTDKVMLEFTLSTIENISGYHALDLLDLFFESNADLEIEYGLNERIYNDIRYYKASDNFKVSLVNDPILSFPWSREKLERTMTSIATNKVPWKEDLRNHQARIFFPMGVCHFCTGLHSSFTGVIKRQGEIEISSNSIHKIVDLTNLYSYIKFNGDSYLFTEKNIVIGKAISFEVGCIYEIGRILIDENITFKNVKTIKSSNKISTN